MIPTHGKDFTASHPSLDGKQDDRKDQAVSCVPSCFDQLLKFVTTQTSLSSALRCLQRQVLHRILLDWQ
jgi:hypothetical protein